MLECCKSINLTGFRRFKYDIRFADPYNSPRLIRRVEENPSKKRKRRRKKERKKKKIGEREGVLIKSRTTLSKSSRNLSRVRR